MIQKLIDEAHATLTVTRKVLDPVTAVEAFRKIDAVIASSVTLAHLDVAERMFERMVKHYGFTQAQIDSPLITGLWKTIMDKRNALGYMHQLEDLQSADKISAQAQ